MMIFRKHSLQILLIGILLIAAILRLWQLGQVPISPDWDEASYGYNAYSVIKTGKDEFGARLPVVLRSFDDYKPALYLYLVIPFVSIMGVTTEAVRLPSAIAGIITVWLTFLLLKLLVKRNDIALLSAFLLAISPWHIQFSRIAFEANVGVLLNMSMVYFFIRGLQSPRLLSVAAAFGALSIYVYQSEKVFTPLLALTLVIIFINDLKKIARPYLLSAFVIGIVLLLPMIFYLGTNEQALTRARETSIFADTSNLQRNIARLEENRKAQDYPGMLFDNRRVFYLTKIIDGYISHFSLKWLFISGDNPRHHAPYMGLLYLVEMPFLLLGIYSFLFLPISKRVKWLVFLWFLLAPVPASITSGVPHAVRTINFLPVFQLFTAVGIITVYSFLAALKLKAKRIKTAYVKNCFLLLLGVGFGFNIFYYLNQYFVQMNYYYAKEWQYGYEEVVPYVNGISGDYDKIVVSNQVPLDQSYIFFLYYLKFDPVQYQKAATENASGGFAESHAFGKYEFRAIDWDMETKNSKILFIGRPQDFPANIRTMKIKLYPDGSEAMRVVRGDI